MEPGWTRTYYVEILKREMDAANQRKQYRHIIQYLNDLSTYPGGQKAAKELAEYWHVYHRNRPAMKGGVLACLSQKPPCYEGRASAGGVSAEI